MLRSSDKTYKTIKYWEKNIAMYEVTPEIQAKNI